MWKSVQLKGNYSRIDFDEDDAYFMKYYVDKLMSVTTEEEERLKESEDWDLPPAGENMNTAVANRANWTAWMKRRVGMRRGRLYFFVKPHVPLILANQVFPLNTNLTFMFKKAEKKVLFGNTVATNNDVVSDLYIHKMAMETRYRGLDEELAQSLLEKVERRQEMVYNINMRGLVTHQVVGRTTTLTKNLTYSGNKPSRVFVIFQDASAAQGSTHACMHNFVRPHIKSARILWDSNIYPPPSGWQFDRDDDASQFDNKIRARRMEKGVYKEPQADLVKQVAWSQERQQNHQYVLVTLPTDKLVPWAQPVSRRLKPVPCIWKSLHTTTLQMAFRCMSSLSTTQRCHCTH